jgi:hypothetical protein
MPQLEWVRAEARPAIVILESLMIEILEMFLTRFQPVTVRHPNALWHFLRRNNFGLILRKFETQGPTTQDATAADRWRLEYPMHRSS